MSGPFWIHAIITPALERVVADMSSGWRSRAVYICPAFKKFVPQCCTSWSCPHENMILPATWNVLACSGCYASTLPVRVETRCACEEKKTTRRSVQRNKQLLNAAPAQETAQAGNSGQCSRYCSLFVSKEPAQKLNMQALKSVRLDAAWLTEQNLGEAGSQSQQFKFTPEAETDPHEGDASWTSPACCVPRSGRML